MSGKKSALLVMSLVFSVPAAIAGADVETIVKYRQGVMTSMRGHVSASVRIVLEGYEAPGHLKVHAAAMAGVTNDIPALFPEGSASDDSEALPAVWEQPEKFAEAAMKNHSAAKDFARAVNEGADAQKLATSLEALLDTCGGCHDDFRVEHE